MPRSMHNNTTNPLAVLWNAISTVGSVLGLASLASTWIKDFQTWQSFAATVIQTCRMVVSSVYEIAFFWLPIQIPEWLQHYLILGVIFYAAASKAESNIHVRGYLLYYFNRKGYFSKSARIFRNALAVIVWPLSLIGMSKELGTAFVRRRRPIFVRHTRNVEQSISHSAWFLSMMLGAVILLSLAAQI